MKQILQNLGNGETLLVEVPVPRRGSRSVLCESTRSLVSLGTEKMLIDFGKGGLIAKARSQPDKVKQVLQKVKTDGLWTTVDAVKAKLDQPIPLGYCNVGRITEVSDSSSYSVGDRVASNGAHAEQVVVPENLTAKIPDSVSDETAVFTVVGAIGLQGIRLIQPTLGERIVVVGLGLIGLLSVQILRAAGCQVLGVDFDRKKLDLAEQFGATVCDLSAEQDPVLVAEHWTNGVGVDGVLVTASAKTDEIMHQAATMCRQRGRIVLVGVVGLDLQRADFYEKELSFQVSCSYGPGRYDRNYEQRGLDYPIGFVRWTEQRNFEAVLQLMADGKIDVDPLITHRFAFDDALEGYKAIGEPGAMGIVLAYGHESCEKRDASGEDSNQTVGPAASDVGSDEWMQAAHPSPNPRSSASTLPKEGKETRIDSDSPKRGEGSQNDDGDASCERMALATGDKVDVSQQGPAASAVGSDELTKAPHPQPLFPKRGEGSQNFEGPAASAVGSDERMRATRHSPHISPLGREVRVAFVGAGGFTTRMLLPLLPKDGVERHSIVSGSGASAAHAAKKFGFKNTVTDAKRVYEDPDVDAVFITTPHNLHASMVCDAIESGKHVFVEKPLALSLDELSRVKATVTQHPNQLLMIGFNRRFSPHSVAMKHWLRSAPANKAVIITVNAGAIPANHWTQDLEVGGGRIVGEACHFIDLARFLVGEKIENASAFPILGGDGRLGDCVTIQLTFVDGSTGTIHYLANGNQRFPKERIEVFAGGKVMACDNFRVSREIGGTRKLKTKKQDKGHAAEMVAFLDALARGGEWPILLQELFEVSQIAIECQPSR